MYKRTWFEHKVLPVIAVILCIGILVSTIKMMAEKKEQDKQHNCNCMCEQAK